MSAKKTIQRKMGEIAIGVWILGVGIWYFIPYVIVLSQKHNEQFFANLLKKTDKLFYSIYFLSKEKDKYLTKWEKEFIAYANRKIETKEEEYKELPMLTYTKQQKKEIDYKLAGYINLYRKLKLFFFFFYLPVLLGGVIVSVFAGLIKRMEYANQLLSTSENLQKIGYIGVFISFLGFFIVYGVCPEVSFNYKLNLPSWAGFSFWSLVLCVSLYGTISQMPYTQQPSMGK